MCSRLDDRRDAVAFRLKPFEFDVDDLGLWAPAFEVLSAQATWIVGVIEEFNRRMSGSSATSTDNRRLFVTPCALSTACVAFSQYAGLLR